MQMPGKAVLKNLTLLLASMAVSLLILEVATRAYSAMAFPRMMVLDDRLGWRHARDRQKTFVNEHGEPILVRQNEWGLRGPPVPLMKPPGTHRLLALGDSFTEAVHVEEDETVTGRLAAMLPDVEMLNAGVGGYGTVQEYLYLETEGLKFEPDVVLLLAYANDLSDNCTPYSPGFGPRPYAVRKNDRIVIENRLDYREFEKFALPVPAWSFLNKHSYLYSFLNTRIYQRLLAEHMRALAQADQEKFEACGELSVFMDLIGKMQALVDQHYARLIVVLIPTAKEAEAGLAEDHDAILERCANTGITCLSLLRSLNEAIDNGRRPYFERDIHWTAAGHDTAATALAALLRREESLDRAANEVGFDLRE